MFDIFVHSRLGELNIVGVDQVRYARLLLLLLTRKLLINSMFEKVAAALLEL